MELLYFAVLDNGKEFEFVSKDTLTHPLDFIDRIAEIRDEQVLIAMTEGTNLTEVYGVFGHESDVDIFKDVLFKKALDISINAAFHNYDDCDFNPTSNSTLQEADYNEDISSFFDLCVPIARAITPWSNANYLQMYDDEAKFKMLVMTMGDAFPSKEECRLALRQFVEAWIEQEEPALFKRQMITTGFLLNPVRGKKIIAPFFNPNEHRWELLLEGARRICLNGEDLFTGQQTDSSVVGRWTEVDIELILAKPAYGYGIHFFPQSIANEWVNALLYCCAVSVYIRKWNLDETRKVYRCFLTMLKKRLPYETGEPIVDESTFLETFLKSADRAALSLRGIEESSLTRRFALEMPYRVYHLNAIMPILHQNLPEDLTLPLKPQAFNREKFRKLLASCKVSTASVKGLALEDLTAYMLSAIEGWLLAGRRVKADDCEIDLCYVNASLTQSAWEMGAMLLVECKNRIEVTGVSVLRNLSFVMDAKGCKTGLIVSMSGFSKVAVEQSIRLACQGKSILLISRTDLDAIADGIHPSILVSEKYTTLQKHIEDDLSQLY